MDRKLLEEILVKMKNSLREGKDIGSLKVGALYALGSQLEAIFYFMGHELGSRIPSEIHKVDKIDDIVESLKTISAEYSLGEIRLDEKTEDHITFSLIHCNSCKDFPGEFNSQSPFCSFESGLFAGIVEKISNKHCFAQELSCRLQTDVPNCQFMIVIPQEE